MRKIFKEVMKNFIFHHGLSGEEVKDPLPELGFIPRSGSQNAKNSILQRILKNILFIFTITLIFEVPAYSLEKIRLENEEISELKDYQIGYRSNLAPLETHNESSTIKIPVAKIKPKIGVLNTELIYQPWDKTYQIGGSLDLMEITKKYKQEQRLARECGFDLSKCSKLTADSTEEYGKTIITDIFSHVKETTKEVYKVTKDQFSICNENNICY